MTFTRPKNKKELQEREAVGVFRASRFVRKYAVSRKPISINTICIIHKDIFNEAWHEIAGIFREENISRISGSDYIPPSWQRVPDMMQEMKKTIKKHEASLISPDYSLQGMSAESEEFISRIQKILKFAAYVHHAITYIHPFRDGNGRVSRLTANLIFERYGLMGISIKIERENKNRYCNALAQIDKFEDFEPLLTIMAEGLIDRYKGVPISFAKK